MQDRKRCHRFYFFKPNYFKIHKTKEADLSINLFEIFAYIKKVFCKPPPGLLVLSAIASTIPRTGAEIESA